VVGNGTVDITMLSTNGGEAITIRGSNFGPSIG